MQLPTEKGPGPDGYIGAIYMSCWNIIRADLVAAIRHIFFVRNRTLGRMTLGVEEIFWFISHTLPQCHVLQGVGDTYLYAASQSRIC
jgi:hypothetical protein